MEADQDDLEHFQTPEQFTSRIKDIVSAPCNTHEEIDDALRTFIEAVTSFHRENILQLVKSYHLAQTTAGDHESTEDYIDDGCIQLLTAGLFNDHREYVRRQFIYGLMQVRSSTMHDHQVPQS